MIDLCIAGSLCRDSIVFSVNGETKTINQFNKSIHFLLIENKEYRIFFDQQREEDIPIGVKVLLEILFFPIRGVFNVILYNTDQDWEKDISVYKVSGYIDVKFNKNTNILFNLKYGGYDANKKQFYKPEIVFSPDIHVNQITVIDVREISLKHSTFLKNLASVGLLFFILFAYLLVIAINNAITFASIFISIVMIFMGFFLGCLILHSFKKKKFLLTTLYKQQSIK